MFRWMDAGTADVSLSDQGDQEAPPNGLISTAGLRSTRHHGDAVQAHIDEDNMTATYETAMCDVLVSEPAGTFGYEDITGFPWTEIDFPADVTYAEEVILPRILESLGEKAAS